MSDDLISREETLYELATSAVYYFGIEEDKAAHDWAMGVVSKMPSAQPEIVRCKDCKFGVYEKGRGIYHTRCEILEFLFQDDDFCSYGERKEE